MTPNRDREVPTSPFNPISPLFLAPADSDLYAFLGEAHALFQQFPSLVDDVEKDLNTHALRKKAVRVADAVWFENRTPPLPDMPVPAQEPNKPLVLMTGRPRTSGFVVLIALLLRGYSGAGFKSADVTSSMSESITLRVFFTNLGVKMPGRSTLTELVNAVSNDTRLLLLDAQVSRALRLNLDDFKTFLQDSTHVDGNTVWPTDSRLMVDLVSRLIRVGEGLQPLHLSPIECGGLRKCLQKMVTLNREIELSHGKKGSKRTRRRRYEKLLRISQRVHTRLTPKVVELAEEAKALDVPPSQQAIAERAVVRLRADLVALQKVHAACEARVLLEKKVPMSEKVLSLSDPDAGFISKGQREPVIGYKPQIARSGAGFITGLLLPQGNAPDSKNLVPMVDEVIARTTVIPAVVSVDDGYASADNVKALHDRNIEVISINGAKGRALTSCADWESDAFAQARDKRSAVESLMFTLKHGFDFGEVARRGLPAVYAELLEKALAYNVGVTVRLRREAALEATTTRAPTQAAA
ncbi:MAG: transposase [Dehalococcoidia bacterium]